MKRESELMCESCQSLLRDDPRFDTNTENRTRCLNCASNWTRAGIYGSDSGGMDEYTQDARVAARLINIYNECVDWREIHAEDDLRKFLITATLAMISGYQTSSDVLKQVSHRGAIRIPAYMVKGKCRGNLLSQYSVQREVKTTVGSDGYLYHRWFYRLLWDGGNVAYNDYMKTVLTKEEVESLLPANATAEYIGDIFEFWLGMLELGFEFPTMFEGWGPNIDQCLSGLEESFWLFGNSCRHTETANTKRNRSRKAYIPHVEDFMVTKIFYNQFASMSEIGDREEGGPFLVNGVEVHPPGEGVQSRQELDGLVERAAEDSPPVLPSIQELNIHNSKTKEETMKWLEDIRKEHGNNYNFRYLQPYTNGIDIGTLEMARLSGEEYVGNGWCNVKKYAENEWMGRRNDTPKWMTDMSKRFNAALRHSIGCHRDNRKFAGLPCDDAGWVNSGECSISHAV